MGRSRVRFGRALATGSYACWIDAVRLLWVTPEGYAFCDRVSRHLQGVPEFKEVGGFFAHELAAQIRDARAITTSKLDAPVNKAARILTRRRSSACCRTDR